MEANCIARWINLFVLPDTRFCIAVCDTLLMYSFSIFVHLPLRAIHPFTRNTFTTTHCTPDTRTFTQSLYRFATMTTAVDFQSQHERHWKIILEPSPVLESSVDALIAGLVLRRNNASTSTNQYHDIGSYSPSSSLDSGISKPRNRIRLQCKAPGCTQTFSHRSSRSRHHKRFHSTYNSPL